MSEGDPFRDDRDAAVARADALQAELDRTTRERDELAAKLAAVEGKAARFDALEEEKTRTQRRAAEKQLAKREAAERAKERARKRGMSAEQMYDRREKIRGGLIGGAVILVVTLVIVIPGYLQAKEHRAWLVKKEARRLALAEWDAMLDVKKCLHDREKGIDGVRTTALAPDPRPLVDRTPRVYWSYDQTCGKSFDVLAHSTALSTETRLAFENWNKAMTASEVPLRELHEYYEKGDWKDDGYASGPAKWDVARQRIDRVATAVAAVRSIGLPVVRARIAELSVVLSPERQARVAFGLKLDHVADLVHLVQSGRSIDVAAVRREAQAIIDAAATAPLEIRRVLRSSSTLEDIARGTYLSEPSSYEMWDAVDDDDAPVPTLPAEPSMGCDGDGGG